MVIAIGAQAKGIAAGGSLPHPEMAPALLELIHGTTIAGYGRCTDQLREALFSVFSLKTSTRTIAQAGTTTGTGKPLAELPAITSCFKAQLHLWLRHKRIRLHAFEQLTACLHGKE